MSTLVDDGIIRIRSENDAWKALEAALDDSFEDFERLDIQFDGWPKLQIKLDVPDSTISPSMMGAFVELQEAVERTYAILVYGDRDLRKVSPEERQALEFLVKVSAGSGKYDVDGEDSINALLRAAVNRMESKHILIAILGVAVLWFGSTMWNDYLDERAATRAEEIHSEEAREALQTIRYLSEQETRRIGVLADAIEEMASLSRVDDEVNDARHSILKAVPEDVSANIGGSVVDGDLAKELTATARKPSEPVEITGDFEIRQVDTTSPSGFYVRLRRLSDDLTVRAGLEDAIVSESQKRIIRQAEWAKRPIRVRIEGKLRRGRIVDAVIKGVEAVPEE